MNLYLILHKVRGEPAFDIALCADDMGTESSPGPWWIVCTSGHRAYPIFAQLLEEIIELPEMIAKATADKAWDVLVDHYHQPHEEPKMPRGKRSSDRAEWEMLKDLLGDQPKLARRFG